MSTQFFKNRKSNIYLKIVKIDIPISNTIFDIVAFLLNTLCEPSDELSYTFFKKISRHLWLIAWRHSGPDRRSTHKLLQRGEKIKIWRFLSTVNRRSSRTIFSILFTISWVTIDDRPLLCSSWIFVLPALNSRHPCTHLYGSWHHPHK